jgi:isopentenyl phosphate kinase
MAICYWLNAPLALLLNLANSLSQKAFTMIFLKLGGSLITDKTQDNTPRMDVIQRLAGEIRSALGTLNSALVLGHGSGSFGHAAAKKYGTRNGVSTPAQWQGFAEVSVIAARLNRILADALNDAGVPVMSFPPSSWLRCADGRIVESDTTRIKLALGRGIVPLVMGDVAFDSVRGGTIVSTEEVFAHLAETLPAQKVLLAGETEGVYERFSPLTSSGQASSPPHPLTLSVIRKITPLNWAQIQAGVGGSRGADVTGGMAGKVRDMLDLVQRHPTLSVRIFSGLGEGNVLRALQGEPIGTEVAATDDARLVDPYGRANV